MMKRTTQRISSLLAAMLLAVTASAQEITGVTLTITDEKTEEIPVVSGEWGDVQKIDGKVANLILNGYTATTSGDITSLTMQYAIYNSSYTEPNYDDWKQPVSATKTADNTWTATSTEGIDLLNGLYKGSSYVIEFYFEASDGSNTVYYKNGEQNYKVQFTVANNNDAQVTLQQGSNAAGIGLKLNGIALNVKYDSDLNRTPAGDLSDLVPEVTTASITSWFAKFVYKKLISSTSRDASMQYRVYEQGMEGTWNRVDYSSSGMSAGGGVFNFTVEKTNLDINLLENTEPGKTYVLEIMYQFIDNTGSEPAYYFFGRDNANCRATFKVASSTGISSIHHSPFTIDSDAPMYNLAGQKVGKGYKGIIIRNGKKVVMK